MFFNFQNEFLGFLIAGQNKETKNTLCSSIEGVMKLSHSFYNPFLSLNLENIDD